MHLQESMKDLSHKPYFTEPAQKITGHGMLLKKKDVESIRLKKDKTLSVRLDL